MNHFFKIVHGGIQAEDSHEKSKNVIVYNHSTKSTIILYNCTFAWCTKQHSMELLTSVYLCGSLFWCSL